jgi:hypothetical protein
MKKYLMIGFAAVAFAACSNHDFETYTPEQVVKAEYDAKFIAEFGKPAANQNWGFGASTRAFTRTYNVQGNLWHMAKPQGFNLEYDAPVTVEEKNLVFNYVNDKNNVEKVDQITFTQYWVTQIWNGKSDANATGVKAPASESYPDQNGAKTTTVGGGHMDKLDILEKAGEWTHCNNFNAANNTNYKEGGEGGRTLMIESGTLSFRYINSDGSHMSEKYIIVPGEKIHSSLKGFYYVCFDFEKGYTAEEQAAETSYGTCSVWRSQATDQNPDAGYWQDNVNWNYNGFYNDVSSSELQDKLKADNGTTKVKNITFKGYRYGQQHYVGDNNYTDWIVRISPAKEKGRNYTGRIMAEDLSVNNSSDWDFNDVVFDYAIENDKAYILLQAAGGTLPLNVGGQLVNGEVVGGYEVHDAFNVGPKDMVNTGAGPEVDPVPLTLENKTYTSNADIKLFVKKKVDGVEKWVEITAVVGEPAGKFVTQTTTNWVDEYANIKRAYSNFETWVTTGTGEFTPSGANALYFDRITRNE